MFEQPRTAPNDPVQPRMAQNSQEVKDPEIPHNNQEMAHTGMKRENKWPLTQKTSTEQPQTKSSQTESNGSESNRP